MAQQNNEEYIDITPTNDPVVEQLDTFFTAINNGISPNNKPIQNPGFKTNSEGWRMDSSGQVEINGVETVSTNFKKVFKSKGLTFYLSDGTTPNGNLTGSTGDICFGADSGKAYYCTGTTNWTAM